MTIQNTGYQIYNNVSVQDELGKDWTPPARHSTDIKIYSTSRKLLGMIALLAAYTCTLGLVNLSKTVRRESEFYFNTEKELTIRKLKLELCELSFLALAKNAISGGKRDTTINFMRIASQFRRLGNHFSALEVNRHQKIETLEGAINELKQALS